MGTAEEKYNFVAGTEPHQVHFPSIIKHSSSPVAFSFGVLMLCWFTVCVVFAICKSLSWQDTFYAIASIVVVVYVILKVATACVSSSDFISTQGADEYTIFLRCHAKGNSHIWTHCTVHRAMNLPGDRVLVYGTQMKASKLRVTVPLFSHVISGVKVEEITNYDAEAMKAAGFDVDFVFRFQYKLRKAGVHRLGRLVDTKVCDF